MRCQPCERANIVCSLAPDTIPPRLNPPGAPLTAAEPDDARPKLTPYSQQKFIPSSYSSGLPPARQPLPAAAVSAAPSGLPNFKFEQDNTQFSEPSAFQNVQNIQSEFIDQSAPFGGPEKDLLYPMQEATPGSANESESMGVWVKQVAEQPKLHQLIHEYLKSIEAFSMPLRPNRDGLINLYCTSIHTVLPLLDKEQFLKLHDIGQAPTLLLHAVLLVAARHPKAKPFLGAQQVRDFCAVTAEKIRALLYAEVEQDRLTLVRVYALLSLHSEGPDGLENSCCDLQKAIHYSISLGIHHERPFIDREELRRLWWTIWCMDRINACVNARPLICNLEDVGSREVSKAEHYNLGQLIETCKRLENVIYLYRPNPKTKRRLLLLDQDVNELPVTDATSAVFALLHYTAVVLAHKRGTEDASPGVSSSTSPPGTYTLDTPVTSRVLGKSHRRTSSSRSLQHSPKAEKGSPYTDLDRETSRRVEYSNTILIRAAGFILKVIKDYTAVLPPLPLIPYCASLTLTVFLRTYPKSDPIYGFNWQDGCAFLESMAAQWWVAAAMGGMGRKVFGRLQAESYYPEPVQSLNGGTSVAIKKEPGVVVSHPATPTPLEGSSSNTPATTTTAATSTGTSTATTSQNGVSMEDQFLDMFSQLPNATSFLDEALATEQFDEISEWF